MNLSTSFNTDTSSALITSFFVIIIIIIIILIILSISVITECVVEQMCVSVCCCCVLLISIRVCWALIILEPISDLLFLEHECVHVVGSGRVSTRLGGGSDLLSALEEGPLEQRHS